MTARAKRTAGPSWPRGAPDETVELRGGTGAPMAARRAVGARVRDHLSEDAYDDALILVSEIVTNAVRHGGAGPEDRVLVRLAVDDERVYFEICDGGPGFQPPAVPAPRPQGGGMGLVLVQAMTRAWGARVEQGTCVWFELER